MSLGVQDIARGNVQSTLLLSVSLTPAATGANTTAEQTFTIPGLLLGDQISGINFQAAWTVNVDIANYRVSANNTIAISFQNNTAGSVTAPSGAYLIEVNRPSFLPLPNAIQ